MRRIVEALVDRGSFFEIGRLWGRSVITGFARLAGWPVALMASDPMHYGGAWTARASEKVMRFVDLAQIFHLPVVHLVDCPGFLIGPEAEKEGTIRYGMRAASAILQATRSLVLDDRAQGVRRGRRAAPELLALRHARAPGRRPSGARCRSRAAWKRPTGLRSRRPPDPAAKRAEIEARIRKFASPMRSAERFDIEEIIDPRDTRKVLCEFAELAAPLRTPGRSSFGVRP